MDGAYSVSSKDIWGFSVWCMPAWKCISSLNHCILSSTKPIYKSVPKSMQWVKYPLAKPKIPKVELFQGCYSALFGLTNKHSLKIWVKNFLIWVRGCLSLWLGLNSSAELLTIFLVKKLVKGPQVNVPNNSVRPRVEDESQKQPLRPFYRWTFEFFIDFVDFTLNFL